MLAKVTVETALSAELDEHLWYYKHQSSPVHVSRNGHSSKTIRAEDGQFELDTLRDRDGSFVPKLVKSQQTRFTSMDKIFFLYRCDVVIGPSLNVAQVQVTKAETPSSMRCR